MSRWGFTVNPWEACTSYLSEDFGALLWGEKDGVRLKELGEVGDRPVLTVSADAESEAEGKTMVYDWIKNVIRGSETWKREFGAVLMDDAIDEDEREVIEAEHIFDVGQGWEEEDDGEEETA